MSINFNLRPPSPGVDSNTSNSSNNNNDPNNNSGGNLKRSNRSHQPPQLDLNQSHYLSSLSRPQLSPLHHHLSTQNNIYGSGHQLSNSPGRSGSEDVITPRQNSFSSQTSNDYHHQDASLTPITSSFFQDSGSVRNIYGGQDASSRPMLEAWQPSDLPVSPGGPFASNYPSSNEMSNTPILPQEGFRFDSFENQSMIHDSNIRQAVRIQESMMMASQSQVPSPSTGSNESGGDLDKEMKDGETRSGEHSPIEREGLKEEYARMWLGSTYKVQNTTATLTGTSTRRTVKKEVPEDVSNLSASPINRSLVYSSYCVSAYSSHNLPVAQSIFGKIMKKTHPMAQTRRFGSRNASKYCYVNLIPNQEESDRLSALKKEAEEGKEGEMVENAKRALAASDRASGKSSREQSQELELDTIDYAPAHSSKRMRVSSYATSDSSISLGTDPAEAAGGSTLSVPAGQTSGFSPTTAGVAQVRSPVQWYRERLHDSPQSSPGGTSYSTFQHRSRTSSLSSSQSSMFGDSSKGDAASAYSSGPPVDSAPHQSYADIGLEAYSSLLGRNLPHNLLNQLYQRHHSSQNMNQFLGWPSKEISELDVQASQVWKEVEVFMQELVHRGEVGQVEEVCNYAASFWEGISHSSYNMICTKALLPEVIIKAIRVVFHRIVINLPLQQLSENLNYSQIVRLGGGALRHFSNRLESALVKRFFPPLFIKEMRTAADDFAGGLESSISTLLAAQRLSPSRSPSAAAEESTPPVLNEEENQASSSYYFSRPSNNQPSVATLQSFPSSAGEDYFTGSLGLSNIHLSGSGSDLHQSNWNQSDSEAKMETENDT